MLRLRSAPLCMTLRSRAPALVMLSGAKHLRPLYCRVLSKNLNPLPSSPARRARRIAAAIHVLAWKARSIRPAGGRGFPRGLANLSVQLRRPIRSGRRRGRVPTAPRWLLPVLRAKRLFHRPCRSSAHRRFAPCPRRLGQRGTWARAWSRLRASQGPPARPRAAPARALA